METLRAMFTDDTLWIYTGIAGAVFGAIFLAWFRETRMGLWLFDKFDNLLDYLVNRWGWTWLQEPEDSWRKKYPKITNKVDELELRIKNLESQLGTRVIRQKKR